MSAHKRPKHYARGYYSHTNATHRTARNRHLDAELSSWTATNGELTQAQRRDALALAIKARFAAKRAAAANEGRP